MTKGPADAAEILIVGAGAMGIATGYHLSLGGSPVTYLVRPARMPALSRPQILYCYDDGANKTFEGYGLITGTESMAGKAYDFVILTLDGAASRSEEGVALLRDIGNAIRATSAVVITGAVGIGIRELHLREMALPPERVLTGGLGLMCYQVASADLPVHAPTNPALLAQADMAYRHINKNGFMLDDRFPQPARRFASIYGACGLSQVAIMKRPLMAMFSKILFPVFLASELMGWPDAGHLDRDKEVWALNVRAMKEIAGLKDHGGIGKTAQWLFTPWTMKKMWQSLEKSCRPMDFQAFNRFHHGGKVRVQDIDLLRDCVAMGESEGRSMRSLRALLALAEEKAVPSSSMAA